MDSRKQKEADEDKLLMKKLFKPTINKEYGTTKKEKDLCKTASKAMRLQQS